MYQYAYFLGSLLFLPLWLAIFFLRKDLRGQMLFMSGAIAFLGIIFEYFVWTVDWWRPETISGNRVGIEDLLLGFTNGGIGAVLYELVFSKQTRLLKKNSRLAVKFDHHMWYLGAPFLVSALLGILCFWVFGMHSFWATTIAVLVAVFLMLALRHDLLVDSIFGGISLLLVAMPVYVLLIYLFPDFVERDWMLENISGILFLGIPIEDLIFYFLSGMFLAPAYEFLFRKSLVRSR